jgi:hypothetical protein
MAQMIEYLLANLRPEDKPQYCQEKTKQNKIKAKWQEMRNCLITVSSGDREVTSKQLLKNPVHSCS